MITTIVHIVGAGNIFSGSIFLLTKYKYKGKRMKTITKVNDCKKQKDYHKLIEVLPCHYHRVIRLSYDCHIDYSKPYETHKRGLESIKAIRLKKEEACV